MRNTPTDYLFSKKTLSRWQRLLFSTGIIVIIAFLIFPSQIPAPSQDFSWGMFQKIQADYLILAEYDQNFANQFTSFSFYLMITIIPLTVGFCLINMIDILNNGPRLDETGARDKAQTSFYFFMIFFAAIPIYFIFFPTPFVFPDDFSLSRIPIGAVGIIKWGVLFTIAVGLMVPYVLLDMFNRTYLIITNIQRGAEDE